MLEGYVPEKDHEELYTCYEKMRDDLSRAVALLKLHVPDNKMIKEFEETLGEFGKE